MKDLGIKALVEGFENSTGVYMVSYSYITGDNSWSKTLRKWAGNDFRIEKGAAANYITNEVIFSSPGDSIGNYSVEVSCRPKPGRKATPPKKRQWKSSPGS